MRVAAIATQAEAARVQARAQELALARSQAQAQRRSEARAKAKAKEAEARAAAEARSDTQKQEEEQAQAAAVAAQAELLFPRLAVSTQPDSDAAVQIQSQVYEVASQGDPANADATYNDVVAEAAIEMDVETTADARAGVAVCALQSVHIPLIPALVTTPVPQPTAAAPEQTAAPMPASEPMQPHLASGPAPTGAEAPEACVPMQTEAVAAASPLSSALAQPIAQAGQNEEADPEREQAEREREQAEQGRQQAEREREQAEREHEQAEQERERQQWLELHARASDLILEAKTMQVDVSGMSGKE